jgi:hypothetical protein
MKLTLTILSLFFGTAQAVDLPADLNREIRKQFPKAKVLASTPCKLGAVESFGLLTDDGKGPNPLRAVIFYRKDKGKWKVFEAGTHISNSKGGGLFLSDFWKKGSFAGPYQIRCTTPATDVDINTQANGEYSKEFPAIEASTLHLCYQASSVYNNWACFTHDAKADDVKISFVQLNAD